MHARHRSQPNVFVNALWLVLPWCLMAAGHAMGQDQSPFAGQPNQNPLRTSQIRSGGPNSEIGRETSRDPSQTGNSFSSGQSSSSSRSVFNRQDDQRNRTNNSRSSLGSNSRQRGGQQQSATGLNRQEGRQQTRTVRGQSPARARTGQAQKPVVVEFKMKANPNTNILYMEGLNGQVASLNMLAEEGSTFPLRVMFANNRGSSLRDLQVSLKYDGSLLSPLAIDDSSIASRLETESRITHDSRRGIIRYTARFLEPTAEPSLELFRVEFRAKAVSSHSSLSFSNTEANPTRLLNDDGTNILLLRDEDGEVVSSDQMGLLDASIAISPGVGTRRALIDEEGTLRGITMAHSISAGTAQGGIRLALVPRQSVAQIGESFLVDVNYSNPNLAELDSVKLRIIFDPRVLEVLDHDEGNWISKGINILDGPYQEDLPFDFLRRNVAYNGRGEIQYDAGFNSRVRIPSSGTIATIKFRAKQPIGSTAVAFSVDEDKPEQETSISFLGFNLIGTPGRRALALTDAVLSIR
jgi:hypothetical protein